MAANVNNYIRAGNAAVRSAVQTRKALADNKARLDEIGMEAVAQDAKGRVNTAKNNSRTAQTAIAAKRDLANTKTDIETDKKISGIKKGARKAGMLAGGVAMLGAGAMYKNRKDEPDEMLSHYDKLRGKLDKQINEQDGKVSEAQAYADSFKDGGDNASKLNPGSTDKPDVETAPVPQGDQGNGSDAWGRWRNVISLGEGTQGEDGYTTMFGGRKFTDMSAHPNSPMATPWGTQSEAAGKYQFMKPTWDRASTALNLPDFSRDSQEKAGQWLAQQRGVDTGTRITDFNTFKTELTKLSPEWASMPSLNHGGKSYYGQGAITFEQAWEAYNR